MYLLKEFVIEELCTYGDMNNLLLTSNKFKVLKEKFYRWTLNRSYSNAYVLSLRKASPRTFPLKLNHKYLTLDLAYSNWMKDSDLENIGDVRKVNLDSVINITNSGINCLTKVKDLNLRAGYFTDEVLKSLTGIHTLNLKFCRNITDEGMVYLQNLKNLKVLNLEYCLNITDKGISYLGGVESLKLKCINITDECLKHLGNVIELNLNGCGNITDNGIKHLTKVRRLSLKRVSMITNESLKYLKNVEELNLTMCYEITDEGLKYLENVHTLDLSYCTEITDEGLKSLTKLRSLSLRNTNLTNETLKLFSKCQRLDLSYCSWVSDEGLKYLQGVTILLLNRCKNVTFEGLQNLPLENIQQLELQFNENINEEKMSSIGKKRYIRNGDCRNEINSSYELCECKTYSVNCIHNLRKYVDASKLLYIWIDKADFTNKIFLRGSNDDFWNDSPN
jgi:hypothetical protein